MPDRLLTTQFLQRFLDNDLISPEADRHAILSTLAATLVSCGLFLTVLLSMKFLFMPYQTPGRTAVLALDDRFLYIALSMIVMGLLAVATWDGLSLDARDAAVLGPLPISHGSIVRAKIAAVALFATTFAAALNAVPSVLHPLLMTAKLRMGLLHMVTLIVAHALVTMAAGAFAFFAILAVRETMRACLGTTRFVKLSGAVQAAIVLILTTALLLLPSLSSGVARRWLSAQSGWLALPPAWFLGLFETMVGGVLDGMPRGDLPATISRLETAATLLYRDRQVALADSGGIAIVALAAIAVTAVSGYVWNNRRLPAQPATARPSSVTSRSLLLRLMFRLVVRRPIARAGFLFATQSLARSLPHRLSLSVALAVGLAATTVVLRASPPADSWPAAATTGLLVGQTILVIAMLLGFAQAVRVPAELRAAWVFHLTWSGQPKDFVSGVRTAGFAVLCLPVLIGLSPLHILTLGPGPAAGHFACGVLLALVVLHILLHRPAELPFASAYVPAGNAMTYGPIAALALLLLIYGFASVERYALSQATTTLYLLSMLSAILTAFRLSVTWRRGAPTPPEFDSVISHDIQRLGLGD